LVHILKAATLHRAITDSLLLNDCPARDLFPGIEDKVVPPSQAESMVEALRAKGLPVAYMLRGEQHAFGSEKYQATLDGEIYFYRACLDLNWLMSRAGGDSSCGNRVRVPPSGGFCTKTRLKSVL